MMNQLPKEIAISILHKVYAVAEQLYCMQGHTIPEGRSFSRSLDGRAEQCYQFAAAAYVWHLAGD